MGLPQWREPDNSKASTRQPSRSPTDAATGRSPIRRPTSPRSSANSARRRRLREDREQRLRTLMAAQSNGDHDGPLSVRVTLPLDADSHAVNEDNNTPFSVRPALPSAVESRGGNDDTIPDLSPGLDAYTGLPLLDYADEEGHPPPRIPEFSATGRRNIRREQLIHIRRLLDARDPELLAATREYPGTQSDHGAVETFRDFLRDFNTGRSNARTRSNIDRDEDDDAQLTWGEYLDQANNGRASQLPPRTVRLEQRSPPLPEDSARDHGRDLREIVILAAGLSNRRRSRFGTRSRSVRLVDGLGDRDRSLSPEGDGVWDTLQSTLTPDPQPPSVGSSFASTTASTAASTAASAATSQNPTVPSSRTSITGPREDVEPPCDPVNEAEGFVDSSEDAEAPRLDQPRRPNGRLSYAEAAVSGAGPSAEPEWLPGMHHIIRRLAARQDIPDEWWQQAGLSRSMSWNSYN
ncbi:hypothetical protein F5Y05DRAFT_377344 [Hypoxylon sp. FL0543]|nr:hypothetical protein F5Y05DRAFT_377344 [Hypoxylon sp. FL0543]